MIPARRGKGERWVGAPPLSHTVFPEHVQHIKSVQGAELRTAEGLVRLKGKDPIYAARAIFPHLGGSEIRLDARKALGIRRFSSNLPTDFGLRAVMGYLQETTAR